MIMDDSNLMIKIPCEVGAKIFYLDDYIEKEGRKNVTKTRIVTGIVDQIILGTFMIPILNVCDDENHWIHIDSREDIGDWAFLTLEEAEIKLKEQTIERS